LEEANFAHMGIVMAVFEPIWFGMALAFASAKQPRKE
jgi:hypothetical protein